MTWILFQSHYNYVILGVLEDSRSIIYNKCFSLFLFYIIKLQSLLVWFYNVHWYIVFVKATIVTLVLWAYIQTACVVASGHRHFQLLQTGLNHLGLNIILIYFIKYNILFHSMFVHFYYFRTMSTSDIIVYQWHYPFIDLISQDLKLISGFSSSHENNVFYYTNTCPGRERLMQFLLAWIPLA